MHYQYVKQENHFGGVKIEYAPRIIYEGRTLLC